GVADRNFGIDGCVFMGGICVSFVSASTGGLGTAVVVLCLLLVLLLLLVGNIEVDVSISLLHDRLTQLRHLALHCITYSHM
ncbi:hypothetical protein, partial [Pseudomonas syringae group genomosp. 7]|uniref:hypothetical protein n=1 Tax=Pseudomonas syringae group genomosp. 7 TaxID=251699 RepID=UPI00376F9A3A